MQVARRWRPAKVHHVAGDLLCNVGVRSHDPLGHTGGAAGVENPHQVARPRVGIGAGLR